MKYYKLTNNKHRSHNTQWGKGITHKAKGKGRALCSEDVIHVYDHPLKAVMFNPIHANFDNPVLWECRVKRVVANDGFKVGVKQCTTVKQIPTPQITMNQRVRFAIYCALEVYSDDTFRKWAIDWLNGNDRTAEGAGAAAGSAARAAADAAAEGARAAGAAETAWAAAWAGKRINFVALAEKAIIEEER